MEKLRYFKKEGDDYILKSQRVLNVFLILFCVLLGVFGILKATNPKAGILLAVIMFALAAIIAYKLTGKTVFSVEQRTVSFKKGFLNKPVVYSFDDFSGFVLTKIRSADSGLATNSHVAMCFDKNGKEKKYMLRQGGSRGKYADKLAAEVESLMKQEK